MAKLSAQLASRMERRGYISIRQSSDLTGISRRTIQRWVREGRVKHKIGGLVLVFVHLPSLRRAKARKPKVGDLIEVLSGGGKWEELRINAVTRTGITAKAEDGVIAELELKDHYRFWRYAGERDQLADDVFED